MKGGKTPPLRRASVRFVRILFAVLALVMLAACSAPPQSSAPPSRNVAAVQAALAGTLGEPALVEFYTTDCESCRVIRAQMAVLDQQYDGKVKFIYLDADLSESKPYLAEFNVRGVPTIALLDRRGHLVSNLPGWRGEQVMTDALSALLAQ